MESQGQVERSHAWGAARTRDDIGALRHTLSLLQKSLQYLSEHITAPDPIDLEATAERQGDRYASLWPLWQVIARTSPESTERDELKKKVDALLSEIQSLLDSKAVDVGAQSEEIIGGRPTEQLREFRNLLEHGRSVA